MLGSGNGGESLVWWGKWAAQQTLVTRVLGARSRGSEPGEMAGQNDGSHRPRTLARKWQRWAHVVAWEAGGLQRGRQLGGQPETSADLLATEEGQTRGNSLHTHSPRDKIHIYKGQVLGRNP